MGKLVGIVLMVGAIWVGLEIYTEGTQRAFGGLLASLGVASAPADEEPPAQRFGTSVERSHREHQERFGRALGE